MVVVVDRAATGGGDGSMNVVVAAAADATEVETMIEMMMEMAAIGEIAKVLDVAEADGLATTTMTMTKASHPCRRPREMVHRIGRRPRRAPA